MVEYDQVAASLLPIGASFDVTQDFPKEMLSVVEALPLWRLTRHFHGEAGCHPEYAGQVFSRTLFRFDTAIIYGSVCYPI